MESPGCAIKDQPREHHHPGATQSDPKEFLNHVQNNQSQDGVVYVLFAHDFPDFFSGVTHTLHTEITRHKIHEFFCPTMS